MNLGVFNRVNLNQKEDKSSQWERMYSDWSSFCLRIQNNQVTDQSVLATLPLTHDGAKQIVTLVIQPIASTIRNTNVSHHVVLSTEKEVNWCMEVICYGLSLPLSEQDSVKDCVHVYCDWLTTLLPQPNSTVPIPILKQPNFFARKIVSHFYHLFMPRPGAAPDLIGRQALLCHRVLRTIQSVVNSSETLEPETWESLLLFLLSINDSLLAPPTIPNDIGDQLCDRVLGVLLEVWLQACARCFPSPRMWKTLTELCQTWRHRTGLVTQWNRINTTLTARLLKDMYGPIFPQLFVSEEDKSLVPVELVGESLAQSWYRLLHCMGNPVQLARPNVISQTHKFLQYAIISPELVDPSQHPCLATLPAIFVKAMKGIATLVDAFLGLNPSRNATLAMHGRTVSGGTGRPSVSVAAVPAPNNPSLAPNRARCNSILHLFGSWLFEAALLGCDSPPNSKPTGGENRLSSPLLTDRSRASSVSTTSEPSIPYNRQRSATVVELPDISSVIPAEAYENGRAEALGALCRIFCAKKTDEDIHPQYLARFYVVLNHALKFKEDRVVTEAMASVMLHSADLLRVDLDGVFTLLPSIVEALETILPSRDIKIRSYVNRTDLRRASIHLLLSMLALPLHFQQLHIKEVASSGGERTIWTFSQLRPRLTQLLISALQIETDPTNTHILLGGLVNIIHDAAAYEQTEQLFATQTDFASVHIPTDSASNIISSTSDTHSCHSTSSTSYPSLSESTLESHEGHDISFTGSSYNAPALPYPLWSFHGLFVHASHLVCHRLLSSWKGDLNTSLAALELLATLARIRVVDHDVQESRRVVRLLCEYIVLQCSRPPPAHSKDLHSTIVAAFNCCAVWLLAHPYLTADQECLHAVLQVVELGISGTKSQGKANEGAQMKHEKELKPVSLRVRDAAELLLTSLVEQVGNFPSPCGAHSLSCLLDESALFHQSPLGEGDHPPPVHEAARHFRYFAAPEGSILLSILEQSLGNDQDPQPTVTLLLRNAFGRQAWTLQLRHLPRHKCGVRSQHSNPGRPLPMNDIGMKSDYTPQYFPDVVDRIRPCLADKSIPSLDSHLSVDDRIASELDKLGRLVDTCPDVKVDGEDDTKDKAECQPPTLCHEFQTARLFLSHLGFLSLENIQENLSSRNCPLISLDSTSMSFALDLDALDRLGNRTHDTLHVFYVRSGQKTAEEILSNVLSSSTVHLHFLEFLTALGWPVDIQNHPGWSGHINTSWKVHHNYPADTWKDQDNSDIDVNSLNDHGGSIYNGQSRILYWADGFSELAVVVPTPDSASHNSNSGSIAPFHRSSPQRQSVRKNHGNDTEPEVPQRRRTVKQSGSTSSAEVKMVAVWLESYEDHINFPIGDLLDVTSTGQDLITGGSIRLEDRISECFVIFIHALNSGLFRIHLKGPQTRINLATPLVDGMIVSRRTLGPMVRQTALNMAKRRRLDLDSYQLPHARRKIKIQELASRYRAELQTPEFYTRLFSSPVI